MNRRNLNDDGFQVPFSIGGYGVCFSHRDLHEIWELCYRKPGCKETADVRKFRNLSGLEDGDIEVNMNESSIAYFVGDEVVSILNFNDDISPDEDRESFSILLRNTEHMLEVFYDRILKVMEENEIIARKMMQHITASNCRRLYHYYLYYKPDHAKAFMWLKKYAARSRSGYEELISLYRGKCRRSSRFAKYVRNIPLGEKLHRKSRGIEMNVF